MLSKKRKLPCRRRQFVAQLERKLLELEAQIAALAQHPELDLAARDHFAVWRRPPLFARQRHDQVQ